MTQWFAFYCRNESKAAKEIEELGHEWFLPTYVRLSKWRRQTVLTSCPLLVGYVFAKLDNPYAVTDCEHISYVVGSAGEPRPIATAIIEHVRDLVESGELDEKLPCTKARPRGKRRGRGLQVLRALIEAEPQPIAA